jgi:signal transduction histidine kinase/ligand-binding sensor domain-containing protein/DNA-binding response OmpR family regulator
MKKKNRDRLLKRFCFVGSPNVPKAGRAIYVLLFLLSSATVTTFGQALSSTFRPVAPEILANASIRCFFKDSKGYMWIGTEEEGLVRFDGSNAYRYVHNPDDKTSVPHSTVNTIIEGKDEQLWIGTAQGLCIYNRELDNFINVDSIKGTRNYLNNRFINDLEFDAQGKLWIGTHEGGINIYDPVKREFSYIIDPPQGGILPSSNFINVLVNSGNTMWCASKGGLFLYNTETKERLPLKSLSRFSDVQISSIVSDGSGSLWMATVSGQIIRVTSRGNFYSIDELMSGEEFGQSSNRVLTFCFDNKRNILTGGENSGFNYIHHDTYKVDRFLAEEGNPKRLPTNSIQSLYADDLGFIWIGTINHGAFVIDNNKKKFQSHEGSTSDLAYSNSEVRSFAEDHQGNIWIAFYGVGLGKINSQTGTLDRINTINRKLGNKNIISMIFDKHGELWLGTAGEGVFRVNPNTHRIDYYSIQSDGFGNNQVFCLYEDRRGTIWAGTWGSGLFFLDKTSNKFVCAIDYGQPNHLPNTAYVTDILEDSKGTFWIATLYGLYELNRTKEDSFRYRMHIPDARQGSLNGFQVHAVVEDQNRNLWIGTTESLNLKKYGDSTFTGYPMNKAPRANTPRSILTDHHGNVWIGGSIGLSKFDIGTSTFVHYTRDDGLKSNNFHRGAALASSSGKFYFGSNNGFDSFFPDSISKTSTRGTVVLTDLKISNQSVRPAASNSPLQKHISLTSDLVLSYDQRSFMIDFAVLDSSPSSNYVYCYKLEGFDKDFNCTVEDHSATYTNIDPGSYVFVVKAANRDGVWIGEPVKLTITIDQVFWKTRWAFSIYVAGIILFVYLLVRIRIERLKMKNEIMLEKLKREQEHELSESKSQFFTNIAHEFRTPLSLILIPLESLVGTTEVPKVLRDRIGTAYKNADHMKRLVNELLDFNKLEAGNLKLNVQYGELIQFIMETSAAFQGMAASRSIKFAVNADEPLIFGWFDREKLERIIFNVLSNAFKFTRDSGEIALQVGTKHSIMSNGSLRRCIELRVEDNGIGILPDELPRIFEKFYQAKSSFRISSPGTGIGLSFTKALVELHNGTISAESVPDLATIFIIQLPIDASAYELDEDVLAPQRDVLIVKKSDVDLVNTESTEPNGEDNTKDKPRILVAEDNIELREYLVAELRTEFLVFEAADGDEGLAICSAENPDLIISDIMMPGKDGIEFCRAIKSDLNTSHIPFILLTAKATIEDQIRGVQTGADLYISKPFSIRYLVEHVRQIIASRQKLYARFSQDVYLLPGKATSNALDQAFLQKTIDYVVANLKDPQLGVDSIPAIFNLSRMQVYRKIKALTGKSVVEFIKMVRMKEAIKLMDTHKMTLSEIAYEVGFNSASYFTRCFKEEYGKTPSEYLGQN